MNVSEAIARMQDRSNLTMSDMGMALAVFNSAGLKNLAMRVSKDMSALAAQQELELASMRKAAETAMAEAA